MSEYKVGTKEITIRYEEFDSFKVDSIKSNSASAVTLYTQVILPLIESNMKINLYGSTDTANSIPMYFMKKVFEPFLM